MILHGDCLEEMKKLPANSVHAIVTDPPYGLAFMGKKWDYDVPSVEIWREALRVLRPGGHLLSFGGTRTYHRMVVAIEDAGFEIRDQIQWLYGSGFPKSRDISKAIDSEAGETREVIERRFKNGNMKGKGYKADQSGQKSECNITVPATDAAKEWEGWGTALKPANEPIVLARKPLEKGLTVAENVLRWGTGALNIDAGRIECDSRPLRDGHVRTGAANWGNGTISGGSKAIGETSQGRWPANVLFDEEAARELDAQTQNLHGAGTSRPRQPHKGDFGIGDHGGRERLADHRFGDSGGASRFFYVAKASKKERGDGNAHPTVKPVKLMEYLIKLVTPPTGTVLDPFCGSGTTGVAAKNLEVGFIGIEREAEYAEIARRRIA